MGALVDGFLSRVCVAMVEVKVEWKYWERRKKEEADVEKRREEKRREEKTMEKDCAIRVKDVKLLRKTRLSSPKTT